MIDQYRGMQATVDKNINFIENLCAKHMSHTRLLSAAGKTGAQVVKKKSTTGKLQRQGQTEDSRAV